MWAGLGPPEALGEHKLLPFLASRGTTSLAHGPSLHPHSQQPSTSHFSLPLTLPPPSYKDTVMTLGPQGIQDHPHLRVNRSASLISSLFAT